MIDFSFPLPSISKRTPSISRIFSSPFKSLSLILIGMSSLLFSNEEIPRDLKITNLGIELETGTLFYQAATGLCPIFKEGNGGEKKGELFFISYVKETNENRPITFVFPGGPGGAGTIESILSFGPRRLLTADEGRSILPPYQLIDNRETLLEYTDLVFVDPIECGFSRCIEESAFPSFCSVEGDIDALVELIYTYIDQSCRWNSPIYLAGSSYGTLRSCGLVSALAEYGIGVKGLILNGCALEFSTLCSQRDESLPDWLLIPTFAATAWYHGRLWPEKELEEVVDYARRFTYEQIAPYMLQPSRWSHAEKIALEEKLAHLTGLSPSTIRRYNLRLNEAIYTAEFFSPERKILGGLDTRYSGDIAPIDPAKSNDPSYLDSIGIEPAFLHYLQNELGTSFPFVKYTCFSPKVRRSWDFQTFDSFGAPHFLQRLRKRMIVNPLMKIFVACGYYDCRTPFAAAEFCFDHLDLPLSYHKNIQFHYYEAGHGLVFDSSSLKKMKNDLAEFYRN